MSKKLEKEIEELKKRIEELEGKQPKPEPAELPFWMPTKDKEKYYYFSGFGVASTIFKGNYQHDQERIAMGNYAETQEICETRKAKLELLEEIKQWRGKYDPDSFKQGWKDKDSCKWELVWNVGEALWDFKEVLFVRDLLSPLGIYFSFYANTNAFLEHFGKRLDILLEEV
jgi:hypothetical protein